MKGEERTDRSPEREDELRVQRTEEELKAGSNRESLTRALGRFRLTGGVEVKDRRIHVVDVDVLTRIAGSGRLV